MNQDQKNELKLKIINEIKGLKNNMDSLKAAAQPVSPDNAIGRLSRQDAMQSQQVSKNSLAKATQRIAKLQGALTRLETQESFGICAECEEEIPFKRLLLIPESVTCVKCVKDGVL